MDTLLIPCYDRPELLHHTLDNLVKTGDLHTVHVIFKPDYGHAHGINDVIREYAGRMPSHEIKAPTVPPHKQTKQSKNVLDGWQYAAQKSDGLVFMVEEDIMVSRDFFRFHRAVHEQAQVFACLSTKNHNRSATVTADPEAYYLSGGDYCSLGVSMRREVIHEHIAPHANPMYYRDCVRYCRYHFPDSSLADSQSEQDGLIRRIQHESGLPTAYPHVPRAFHAGFYGYNRPNNKSKPTGQFHHKVETLSGIIYNSGRMEKAALTPAYYHDSQPVELNIGPWNKLRQEQPPEFAA